MTIMEPCPCGHVKGPRFPHDTVEECEAEMRAVDGPNARCQAPTDHHRYTSRINLHRGEWTYIVLDQQEHWIDATTDVIEAFRIACKEVSYRTEFKQIRRGLAYGFIVQGPSSSVTIVPTPRYKL